jgi:hypothetical protein
VIVMGAGEGTDRDDPITSRAIFYHHWLAPASAEPICEQPRADVDSRSRAERQQKFHRALRPALGKGRRSREQERREQA